MTDVAIVGWGHTPFRRSLDLTVEGLIVAAGKEAVASAGIDPAQIDGIWLGHFNSGMVPDGFCSSMALGIDPAFRFKPATRVENACASGSAAVYAAIDAIRSGRVKAALVIGVEKMSALPTDVVTKAIGGAAYQPEEGHLSFPDIFAQYAKAYAEKYGDPTEAMAHIAVKNHTNAMKNPLAQMQREFTLEYCLAPSEKNPYVSAPLKMTDCSLMTDGAAALVLVAEELLPQFPQAVRFRANQQVNDYLPLSKKMADLTAFEGPRQAIAQAYKQANVTVRDISLAEVHDCFTIAELLMTESLQLTEPGKGREFVIEGNTRRDGVLPMNLSGGLKAKGHPIGATGVSMHVLATRQLLGLAEDMQLPNAELAITVNMGGGAVSTYASILERVK